MSLKELAVIKSFKIKEKNCESQINLLSKHFTDIRKKLDLSQA